MKGTYTVFDFETTGLDPEKDRVIELAAIRVVDDVIVGEFSAIVLQPLTLTPKITEITGITQGMMENGTDEQLAFRILNKLMFGSVLVAHNAGFDMAFLHYTLQRLASRSFANPFIDTLTISRDRSTYPHKLEDMCSKYGITLEGAHRALNDVRACWELLRWFDDEDELSPYVNRLGYLSKYGPPKWAPDYAELVPTENRYEPRTAG